MVSNLANSAVAGFEVTLFHQLKYRVISRQATQRYQGPDCSISLLGKLQYNSQTMDLESLADVYLQTGDLQSFYGHLSGQFTLLIFDEASGSFHLMIDPMGINTCYYSVQSNCIYISESLDLIKSTAGLSCTLSEQAIFDYFYFHCIPAPATIYKECFKLEPGKVLSFSSEGGSQSGPLFTPEFSIGSSTPPELEKECLQVIDEAVAKCRNRSSGAFLSGGLDSSTVAGMLARHQSGVRTFSIGFEDPAYDETPYAEITAKHFGTKHEVLYLTADKAAEKLVEIAQFFEEPFGNSSAMAAYFCAEFAKSHGIETLVAGDGGDELFAGNSHYAKQKQFEIFYNAPAWIKSILRTIFANRITSRLPLFRKAASYINQADIPLPTRLGTYNFMQQFGAANMFRSAFLDHVDCESPFHQQKSRYQECTSSDAVNRMMYLDWKFTLADNDLVKVKKMCELAGVAVQFPLLDKAVVDFSCKVPASIKLPGGRLRDFYKRACSGFLAEATLTKSKHGFGLPFGLWIKENVELNKLAKECLESFRARSIVKDKLIDDALRSHESIHSGYYGELIWIMVVLELWLQREEQ